MKAILTMVCGQAYGTVVHWLCFVFCYLSYYMIFLEASMISWSFKSVTSEYKFLFYEEDWNVGFISRYYTEVKDFSLSGLQTQKVESEE